MTASDTITEYITALPAWQADFLTSFREIIHAADPSISEEWKWSIPVYSHNGNLICATGVFKDHVKINFFNGAQLADQSNFNAGLESKKTRAIDFKPTDKIDKNALTKLVIEAVALTD